MPVAKTEHITMSLGELIYALRQHNPEAKVFFEFGGISPGDVDSWRGDYAQLALGWKADRDGDPRTVAQLLENLTEAIGKEFEGYKGGIYMMRESTQVWVDRPGEYTSTALVRVKGKHNGNWVYLKTKRRA